MKTLTTLALALLAGCGRSTLTFDNDGESAPGRCEAESAKEDCDPAIDACYVGACAFGRCLKKPSCLPLGCADECDPSKPTCAGKWACDDEDPATVDRCEVEEGCALGRCSHRAAECDHCDAAEVQQALCGDGDACTADRCDEVNACVQQPMIGCAID